MVAGLGLVGDERLVVIQRQRRGVHTSDGAWFTTENGVIFRRASGSEGKPHDRSGQVVTDRRANFIHIGRTPLSVYRNF